MTEHVSAVHRVESLTPNNMIRCKLVRVFLCCPTKTLYRLCKRDTLDSTHALPGLFRPADQIVILSATNADLGATEKNGVNTETASISQLLPEGDGWTVAFAQGDVSSLARGVMIMFLFCSSPAIA